MISRLELRQFLIIAVCFGVIVTAGCKKGTEKAAQPEKETTSVNTMSPSDLKALPTVTLTGTKIQENMSESEVRIEITASGAFGSNVVRKADPERIIVVLHNATKGNAPPVIEVNNGAINRVAIDQLNVGNGTAVRITIGLEPKADHVVTPAKNGLIIDVRRRT